MAMAEKLSIEPDTLTVDVQWPSAPEAAGSGLLDSSLARFEIKAGSAALTSFQTDEGLKNTYLTVPAYYLVEWLAQNWWSFLYEPRKDDRSDADSEFRSRHWMGVPRNGFALPDLMFVPSGETTEIIGRQAYLRFAQLSFTETSNAIVRTKDVRDEFGNFVEAILAHMSEQGVKSSEAHIAWKRVVDTSSDDELYCRLIGSMGLSPYVEHSAIDEVLDRIASQVTGSVLKDLCDAATLSSFARAAEFTKRISEALDKSSSIEIEPVLRAKRPDDNVRQAYDWGYNAASEARKALGISHDKPDGRLEFFRKLGFDPKISSDIGSPISNIFPIQAAVSRAHKTMKLALSSGTDKEFSAARASFLAWLSNDNGSRLVTTARTREQRASRAFGAELLAPAEFLKKRLGRELDVSPFTLDKVSDEIGVASTIVRLQARNNGYRILEAA
jgi:hypothetical protein